MNTATAFQTISSTLPARPNTRQYVAELLTEDQRQETLMFLSLRPLQTVIMSGMILDNGMESPINRGAFFGCRDSGGQLVGVALIGRNTLLEIRDGEAVEAIAECVRLCPDAKMVFAEETKLSEFWKQYAKAGEMPRSTSTQLLIATHKVATELDDVVELRIATNDNLDQIVSAHAEMVLALTGTDPLVADHNGFRLRCSERVQKGRVWVWVRDGKLIFKTDIICVTPDAIYIEGLWVNPSERGKGYSGPCLSGLCKQLLNGSNTICGFVDDGNVASRSALMAAGFTEKDKYTRIYL